MLGFVYTMPAKAMDTLGTGWTLELHTLLVEQAKNTRNTEEGQEREQAEIL